MKRKRSWFHRCRFGTWKFTNRSDTCDDCGKQRGDVKPAKKRGKNGNKS